MAEDTDNDQKTEEPTGKRLSDAREKGQLPISRELATWALLLAGLIVIMWIGPEMSGRILIGMKIFIEKPEQISLDGDDLQSILAGATAHVALASILAFGLLSLAVIAGTMVQTGFYANTTRLMPDLMKLSPINGFKQIFSMASMVELLKGFVKMVIIGGAVLIAALPLLDEIVGHTGQNLVDIMDFAHGEIIHLVIIIIMIVTVIAVGDLLYQRWKYFKELRMTKQEVKDESKQMEGDPVIKGRLRQLRMEKARKRMMAQVPKADVVVTNPTHYAVALQYDGLKMAAPVLLAKGTDRIAAKIREVAEENGVPLVSNPPLARALYDTVELDQPITAEHYRAVAEVISYVYKLKGKNV